MKILIVSEFTGLGTTGYSNYYKQIARGLHDDGHEILELASYGDQNNPAHVSYANNCDWKIFLNIPQRDDDKGNSLYKQREESHGDAKFGAWNYENIMLDFMPDTVISIRDHWYDRFIINSPSAKYTTVVLSPTVDSMPQKSEWLETYGKADVITTYNEWSQNWLKQQYASRNLVEFISPCADDSLKILNTKLCRQKLGLPTDSKIVGTVMRNQTRKRFPELFKALAQVDNLYLHCHTGYPDDGWDMPELILRNKVQDRVFFTYRCKRCNAVSAKLFSGRSTRCDKCGGTKVMPNASVGVTTEDMSVIFGAMDLYIQPHTAEGFGIPVIEAAKCGIKSASTDYSAQEDIIRRVGGIPIPPLSLETEIATTADRATMNVQKIVEILSDENSYQYNKQDIKELYEKNYNWDSTIKKWQSLVKNIESTKTLADKNKWFLNWSPVDVPSLEEIQKINLTNESYVIYCILNVAQSPDIIGTYLHCKILDDLNSGEIYVKRSTATGVSPYNRENVYRHMLQIRNRVLKWEDLRVQKIKRLVQAQKNR